VYNIAAVFPESVKKTVEFQLSWAGNSSTLKEESTFGFTSLPVQLINDKSKRIGRKNFIFSEAQG
jgi:hypothetical protein